MRGAITQLPHTFTSRCLMKHRDKCASSIYLLIVPYSSYSFPCQKPFLFLQLRPWSNVCLRKLIFAQLITKLLNSQNHYCIHRSPPLATIPKHMNSLNAVTVHFFVLNFKTILPAMPTSPRRVYHLLTK